LLNYLQIFKQRISENELILDSLWAILGNFFGKGLSVYSGILLAKLLEKKAFGEYSLIKNPLFASSMFFTFGFGYLVTKLIAENIKNGQPILRKIINWTSKFSFIFSGIISLLLIIFSDFISLKYFNSLQFRSTIIIFSIWNIFNCIYTLQMGIFSGLRLFKPLIKVNVITGLVLVFITYFGTKNYGINGAVVSLLIFQVSNVLVNYYLINKKIKSILLENENLAVNIKFSELIKEVLPIGFQEGVYSIFNWLTSIIIIRLSSTSEFGVYNAALQWSAIVLFIPGSLRSVILAHFSINENSNDKQRMIKNVMTLNLVVVLIPAILVSIFSNQIEYYYGLSYKGLGLLIVISMVLSAQMSISNIYSQLFMSEKLNWQMFFMRLLKELILISLLFALFNFPGIKIRGSLLILITSIISNMLLLFGTVFYYSRRLGN
jgi:O-antigen/teichoic acid export membrane protein